MRLPLSQDPPLDADATAAAIETLLSGRVSMGPKVAQFEEAFAAMHQVTAAVFCNSGSSANLLALSALKLKPGDEVIVPAVTWPTSIWPIIQVGAVPVLVDVDPQTLCMDEGGLLHAMNSKTRAIMIVHLLGNPSTALARAVRAGVPVIEDCCEALGSMYGGRPVGTWGRMGTFSFYISHHMTTIEGGMVLCRDMQDANRLRAMRSHGWTRHMEPTVRAVLEADNPAIDPRFLFVDMGYNLRGTDVQAAIGLTQLPKLEGWAVRRQEIFRTWTEAIWGNPAMGNHYLPMRFTKRSVPFAFPLICEGKTSRNALMAHLEAFGIETRPIVAGNIARQPAMRRLYWKQSGDLIGANIIHDRGLYIGLHPGLTDDQVAYFPSVLEAFTP